MKARELVAKAGYGPDQLKFRSRHLATPGRSSPLMSTTGRRLSKRRARFFAAPRAFRSRRHQSGCDPARVLVWLDCVPGCDRARAGLACASFFSYRHPLLAGALANHASGHRKVFHRSEWARPILPCAVRLSKAQYLAALSFAQNSWNCSLLHLRLGSHPFLALIDGRINH